MMEDIGFRNIDVKVKEMLFVFDSVEAMKSELYFYYMFCIIHKQASSILSYRQADGNNDNVKLASLSLKDCITIAVVTYLILLSAR